MESPSEVRRSRKWSGRLIRLGLLALAIVLVGSWISSKVSRRTRNVRVQREQVTDATLGPGDLRIYNRDSTVDLILRGNQVLAGLSPKTIERIRSEMNKSGKDETSGIGGLIASTVKQTVASAIGTHVVYPVAEISDLRYEGGQLVIEHRGSGETRLFKNVKVDNDREAATFREDDARRFIQAVRARQQQLGIR